MPIQTTKKFWTTIPGWMKYATTVVSLVAALAGGIYAMDDRYVSNEEAAQSLQMFNMKMQQDLNKIELQIDQNQLESITTEYYKHKQLIRVYPDDQELQEELENIKERRNAIKKSIKEKMEIK